MHYAGRLIQWAYDQQQGGDLSLPASVSRDGYPTMRGMQKGQVHSVVGRLDPACAAWARYTYGLSFTKEDQYRLLSYALANLRHYGAPGKVEFHRWEETLSVLTKMIDNAKVHARTGGRMYSKANLARRLGVGEDRFKPGEYWGRLDAAVLAAMEDLDRQVITAIMYFVTEKMGEWRHIHVA